MSSLPPFVAHCIELLEPLGAVRARRMFGGHGLTIDGVFVALIADKRLYLKADERSRPAFERAGCRPFSYARQRRGAVMLGYWSAPEEALDSPPAMAAWARLSLAAALKARAAQQPVPHAAPPRGCDTPDRRTAPASAAKTRAARGRG